MADAIGLRIGTYRRLSGPGLIAARLVGDRLVIDACETRIDDASFGVWAAPDRLYVVAEQPDGHVRAIARRHPALVMQADVPSGGASPRCLLPLEAKRRMLVANEEGGTVAVFAVEADGRLAPRGAPASIPGAVFLVAEPD